MKRLVVLFLLASIGFASFSQKARKREMRAMWIASVVNIDWPSKAGLSVNMQKDEMIKLLDMAKDYRLNTVIFQIRPAADAFYKSDLEPWSQWLTGTQGKAPDPQYDPLDFTIDECRKRGLDIHVWLNPYRAVFDTARSSVADTHPIKQHPEWFVTYGKKAYFNPGLPETRDHVASVVSDIVRRYPVDAIHMDDYFYPYRIAGKEFPDQQAFENYPRGFSANEKEDWRRDNVDLIIKQLHDSIQTTAPQVEFGISPFGVWRNQSKDPKGSATKAGQTNYDDLYADILKWQQNGWIDYVTPQIYWHIGKEVADYAIIAEWWSNNALGCPLYIGQAPYRIEKESKTKRWRSSKEIIRQIQLNRSYANIDGTMFFSAKSLRNNPLKLKQRLLKKVYKYEALPPVNQRVQQVMPEAPRQVVWQLKNQKIELSWEAEENNTAFVVYKFKRGEAINLGQAENIVKVTGKSGVVAPLSNQTDPAKYTYVVTGLSITNQESVGVPAVKVGK
jgi:uncharacterized lipoprotein YddW (UPF0748 family)